MRGHVHRRGRTWTYVVDVGRDPATGRRRQRTRGGFPTRKEAEHALAEVIRDLAKGSYVAQVPTTVGEWVDRWLVSIAPKVSESTHRDYEQGLARVVERLGHLKLQALKPLDLEELYADLLQNGRRVGGGLAPKTVRNLHIALRRSLADAERFGLIERNAAALVKAPRVERQQLRTWAPDEVRRFLDATGGDRLSALYRVLATTGMRRGEALGLRWSCVDLAAGRLLIDRSLTAVQDRLVWSSPKTSRSRRTLSLDDATVTALRTHRARQHEERLALGNAWHDTGLVFCNEAGRELHPNRVTRLFNRAVREAELPAIRLHDLRHTWATLALQAGIHPKVVSERLGHSTTGITLDVYSHVQPELDASAASTVAKLFADGQ